MAHWSYLRSCRSVQEAAADPLAGGDEGTPELAARYAIPLFWLAAFDETNILKDADGEGFVLCASGPEAADRLQRRGRRHQPVVAGRLCALLRGMDPLRQGIVSALRGVCAPRIYFPWKTTATPDYASPRHCARCRAQTMASRSKSSMRSTTTGASAELFGSRPADDDVALTAMRNRTVLAGFNRIEPTALDGWPRSPTAAELAFIRSIDPAAKSPLAPDQAQLAKTIREGVSANTLREGFESGRGQVERPHPLGRGTRRRNGCAKPSAPGANCWSCSGGGFFGVLAFILGPLFLWVRAFRRPRLAPHRARARLSCYRGSAYA